MNPQNGSGWPPSSGPGAPTPNNNEHLSVQQRQLGSFGQNHSIHQIASSQTGGPPLISQPTQNPFYSNQSLPSPASLAQVSPLQQNRGAHASQQQVSSAGVQNHTSSYALPGLSQAMQQQQQQQSPPTTMNIERDREMERERQRQQDILMQREYDREVEFREHQQREQMQREQLQREQLQREQLQREQLQREQLQREQLQREQQHHQQQHEQLRSPPETHTSSIPLQHPVASRVPATLHGPNGLLGPHNPGAGVSSSLPSVPLGAPNGPGNIFANTNHPGNESSPRPFVQQSQQGIGSQQLLGFSTAVGSQQLPSGIAALSQGQQPILNDALSYLDQVKVRFVEHPDVYNRFLDIMKDFKSQAIDTPGVIDRVSSLFAGHPELIQGFNTFLPPGYRIECGTGDDPNAIRVTTPMGTTVSQMPSAHTRLNGGINAPQPVENNIVPVLQSTYRDGTHSNNEWPQQHSNLEPMPDTNFVSSGRHSGVSLFTPQASHGQSNGTLFDGEEQLAAVEAATMAHQQEQRGVSHLSNAVSAVAINGGLNRNALVQGSPSGGPVAGLGQMAVGLNSAGSVLTSGHQLSLEKRGPVEFNHAIGYVNKIKQRFSQQPEIYKQFLEILQTYQRESKPIQDVYAQVTQLFNAAPDLLEDFKQFLPESAAQAKAQAAARQATEDATMLSNVRGEPGYSSGMQHNQSQTPRGEMKMPPVGNFAPPLSAAKDNKKRRGGPGSQPAGVPSAPDSSMVTAGQNTKNGSTRANANKRAKMEPLRPTGGTEIRPESPSLIPKLPTPLPPIPFSATPDDIAFFERVKKYLGNKQTFSDFLKLCNLFSRELIDANLLVHKATSFIGSNPDLMSWFKNFVKYTGQDEVIDNIPKIGGDKVVLSNCRGLGPSYRLLPKLEKNRVCSGRDEMCQSVLNDEWVSHPTWASEDSGFIAHRKSIYEEILHRTEEERHDYDFNIEACLRTIQLLEPIAQQLNLMSVGERAQYVLPRGIGGQSETIYERVIKKIYDRTHGQQVIDDMFRCPAAVIPIVLRRLKQKAEEWKASQREWEKVWREQTQKLYWKALDHQGLNAKTADKRQFQPKALITEIQIKAEEQRRVYIPKYNPRPKFQLQYYLDDPEVIEDACHLILTYLHHAYTGTSPDQSRLENFIKTFVPTFFDLENESFIQRMTDVYDSTPPNEEVDDDSLAVEDQAISRGRRAGRKENLLRGVLERGQPGKPGQKDKDDNGLPQSKETTPDVLSMDEETTTSIGTPMDQSARVDSNEHRWMEHPSTGNIRNRQNINHNEPFKRDSFNLYANANIYCFFRMLQMLCERLGHIKAVEKDVHEVVRRSKMSKPAYDLKLIDRKPSDFFGNVTQSASYYRQILRMCEDVVKGDLEIGQLEETLRRYYLQTGWQLYTFDKMIAALLRFALQILVSDTKDKSLEIVNLFYKDRKEPETTHKAELTYRKQVEKLVKEGDIFRIRYIKSNKEVNIAIFKKDDKTFEVDELAEEARWSYYISTFVLRDLTEGIELGKLNWPFLKRNMPPMLKTEEEYNRVYTPQTNVDNLTLRISPNNYHIQYDPQTEDWWIHAKDVQSRGLAAMDEVKAERRTKFVENFDTNPQWMAEKSKEDVDKINRDFSQWLNGDSIPKRRKITPEIPHSLHAIED